MNNASAEKPATTPGSTVAITRNNHTAISVPNFEETIDWYREKLGFEESVRWKAPPHSGEDVQLAFLEFNDARLEVIGGGDPDRLTRPPGSVQDAISA